MVRLFELLQLPGFTLLGYRCDPERLAALAAGMGAHCHAIEPVGCDPGEGINDPDGALRTAYGHDPVDVLRVRPDGYLAA